jgi:radical SAM superfamily enzyme YgiQ (UPF0313 family)
MKFTFIYPDIYPEYPDWPGGFYIAIGSLSSALKQVGHESSLIHVTGEISKDELLRRVETEAPDLIGFSSTSHHASYVKQWAAWLAESEKRVPAIYGGIHPTILPDECIAMQGIDIICRGEGEAPLAELCHKMENGEDISGVPNLWVKHNGTITKNELRNLTEDLDTLPFPDRHIFDYMTLMDEREGVAVFLASRGCPFSCTYCSNHALRKIYGKGSKTVRFRSVDSIIAEIKQVLSDYPFIKMIIFHDDILFLKKSWAEEFAEKYSREIKLPFICNARADVTTEETVNLLKKAGCYLVKVGLESGNEEIRFEVLKRKMTNEQITKAFSLCKKAGLLTLSCNIVGIPYETPAAILDTIKLNASIGVDFMHASIFQPYKGTKLDELCREKNFIGTDQLAPSFYSATVLQMDTVAPSQILMFKEYFTVLKRYYQRLYNLPRPVADFLIGISDSILSFYYTSKVLNLLFGPIKYVHSSFKKGEIERRRLKAT